MLTQVADREEWLAGLKSVPNVAVVYDTVSELRSLPLPRQRVSPCGRNAWEAPTRSSMWACISTWCRLPHLDPTGYRAILLGDASSPTDQLRKSLTGFVHDGGLLIATHETSLRDDAGRRRNDFAWSDLLGVQLTGTSPLHTEANFAWLGDDLRGDAPAYPLLFRVPVLEVKSTTAVKLAELVYPEGHRSPDVFTDGETPYTHFKKFTGKPLVTLNRVGKGAGAVYQRAHRPRDRKPPGPMAQAAGRTLHYEVCLSTRHRDAGAHGNSTGVRT